MAARKIIVTVFLILLVLQTLAYSDEIYLKNGKSFDGEVVERNESSVLIRVEGGTIVFGVDEIDRIVPKELPASLQAPLEVEPAPQKPEVTKVAKPEADETTISQKLSATLDSFLGALKNAAKTFHRELIKVLEKWSWFRNFNRSERVKQFRRDYPFVYNFFLYFTLLVIILIIRHIVVGITRWVLGFFFPKFKL